MCNKHRSKTSRFRISWNSANKFVGGRSAAVVVAKAQAVQSEPELLRAMFDVGYFPPNTPPA